MATLKTTLTETLTLNGKAYGNTISNDITGVNNVYQTVITIPISASVFALQFTSGDQSLGTIEDGTLKYFRITNLDSTNYVEITLTNTEAKVTQIINPGESLVLTDDEIKFGGGFAVLNSIKALADTAEVDVEIFIATA